MTFRPLLSASPVQSSPRHPRISPEFNDLHNKWYDLVVKPPLYQYSAVQLPSLPPPQAVPCNNDFNLNEEDSTTLEGQLEDGTISQFLNRSTNELDINSLGIIFQPLPHFVKEQPKPTVLFNIPNNEDFDQSDVFLKVSIEKFSLAGVGTDIDGLQGMIFLFDLETRQALSDAAYFSFQNGAFIFIQTMQQVAFFLIRKPVPKGCVMACVLFHENAINADAFIESLLSGNPLQPLPTKVIIPFAFSHLNPLSEKEPKKNFITPWTKITTSDALKNIGIAPEEENQLGINGTIICEIIHYNELPDICFNIDSLRNKPQLALPLMPNISDPIVSFTISNIQFSYNNSPKGELVFFKLYVCPAATDPFKPEGLKCIGSRSIDLTLDCYTSFPVLAGRKLFFPDIIRILIEKPLPTTTHLIFHMMALSHNGANLSKICILPLFHGNTLIQNSVITIPVSPLKRIKSDDYLSKIKSSSKTNMIFSFTHPLFLYPPTYLEDFAGALVPQQVNWDDIMKQISNEDLATLAVPFIARLLTIISPETAEYILDYIYKMRSANVKEPIRNWIYSSFDPKTIKFNFISSFTNSFSQIIQLAIDSKPEIINHFVFACDLFSDILIVSFQRRTEQWVPQSIFANFVGITHLICLLIKNQDPQSQILNKEYGTTVFKFLSVCDDQASTFKCVSYHLRKLIELDKANSNPLAYFCAFDFLLPFSYTHEFAVYLATQLPVRPLNNIMFSPFQPIVSLICFSASKAMSFGDKPLEACIKFLNQLFLPLEFIDPQLGYRIGFAFFPILDIISSFYGSELLKPYHFELLPTILYLLAYTPTQLLRNFFVSMSSNFQTLFVEFLSLAAESVIENLTPQITVVNGIYDQLTLRCLNFLCLNINNFGESLPSVFKLISHLVSPYQIPRNYPKIFNIVSYLIKIYSCQRLLVQILLEVMNRKQHIARCFATSLILLFFKADFDERKSVTISSVEVIDALTSFLLHSPVEQISLYKKMIAQIRNFSSFFKNESLTSKLDERMIAANNIAEVIEKLRLAAHPPDERCVYVMQIANQHKTFPSMRMKWLKEIVRINAQSENYPSAFVAQLHICALISTVFMHEEALNSKSNPKCKRDFNFNLIVCQPIRNARMKGSEKYMLGERDFSFFPSVNTETQIDFESISSDFQFISSDFTIDLLKQAIDDAIAYGDKSRLYYDSRCLRSLQLRIFATERNYAELARVSSGLSNSYHELNATATPSHDTPLVFYFKKNKIYCISDDSPKVEQFDNDPKYTKVSKHEPASKELEHLHCWKLFRGILKKADLEAISGDKNDIKLVQYTTKEELPRYTMYSEVVDIQSAYVSLSSYTELETEKLRLLMQQTSVEFEKCFPFRQLNSIESNYKQNIERDMGRIVALFKNALEGEESVFELLKLLRSKDQVEKALELATKLRTSMERLIKVYHRGIEYLQSPNHFMIFKEMRELALAFTNEFKLPEINSKSYEGRKDPLTEHIEYEIS